MREQNMSEDALVAEIVRRVADKIISVQKKALVVYTGSLLGFIPALVSLQQLKDEGFTFDLFLSKSAAELLDTDTLRTALTPGAVYSDDTLDCAPEALAAKYYTILVPAMTVNTAAKIAAGIADTPAARIISNSMMRGKNVVIARDGCCPENPLRAEKGYRIAPALKAKMSANLTALRDYGAAICGCDTISYKTMKLIAPKKQDAPAQKQAAAKTAPAVKAGTFSCDKRVIGRSEIASLPNGAVLRVSRRALVTQFALDAAAQRDIRISKEV